MAPKVSLFAVPPQLSVETCRKLSKWSIFLMETNLKDLRLALGISMLLFFCGCTTKVTYEGARLAATEEVKLLGEKSGLGHVTVITVDGEYTPSFSAGVSTAYLKPGRHSITIQWNLYTAIAQANLWFDAAPGHSYQARASRREGRLRLWIEDQQTGQPVGGIDENPPAIINKHEKG